jgi:hypothetical protein
MVDAAAVVAALDVGTPGFTRCERTAAVGCFSIRLALHSLWRLPQTLKSTNHRSGTTIWASQRPGFLQSVGLVTSSIVCFHLVLFSGPSPRNLCW